MRTALILNPDAGLSLFATHRILEEDRETVLLQTLQRWGIEPEVYYTTVEDHGQGIAAQLAEKHVELIVAVGGDGTIHSVAQGLIGSQSVLGIVPAGTMNNLARSLGIPENLEKACAILADGEARAIDVGRINQHFFLEDAGIGLEAAIAPAAEEVKSRSILSMIRGVIGSLSILFSYHSPRVSLAFDGRKPRTYHAIQVTVCNAPYYGPRLNVAPEIFMNDGWLDVVLYPNFRKREYVLHILSLIQGRRVFPPNMIHHRVKSLLVRTTTAVEIQADGIFHDLTPAEITIVPGALQVQVPKGPVPGLLPAESKEARLNVPGRKQADA